MSETSDTLPASGASRGGGGLHGKLMPELRDIASGLGIKTGGMKKADLVGAITSARSGAATNGSTNDSASSSGDEQGGRREAGRSDQQHGQGDRSGRNGARRTADKARGETASDPAAEDTRDETGGSGASGKDRPADDKQGRDHKQGGDQPPSPSGSGGSGGSDQGDDDTNGSRRNRRRRGRDRERTSGGGGANPQGSSGGSSNRNRSEPDTQILEDDVLTPCAGILDVLDNYAFVRTSGYLPGTEDVYVSLSMVRKLGLRRGDAITGQVRQPREGERKEKFNPLVAIDSVNGGDPEAARTRPDFAKLTPLYPSERLRMETDAANLIGRIIDIAAPIGKGQRGLVVSPPTAGRTTVLRSIAASISKNNPECHLMVVLIDERPEEVTEFERSLNGEVIASTFDRPALDHTTVAELAIERAKRLVELGHDVVVLLDGITRLGRAYNLASAPSGRVLSGNVDSAALYPPKRFFGAARNIENGGSLTILATAVVETGSATDEVILEEFKGTENTEIRLRGEFAERRIFPAIDAVASGSRREELLMSEQELAIVWKLRRVLSSLESRQALELLLERLRKTQTNHEFLSSVEKSTPKPSASHGAD